MRESTRGAGDMADEEPAQEVEQIPFEFDAYVAVRGATAVIRGETRGARRG